MKIQIGRLWPALALAAALAASAGALPEGAGRGFARADAATGAADPPLAPAGLEAAAVAAASPAGLDALFDGLAARAGSAAPPVFAGGARPDLAGPALGAGTARAGLDAGAGRRFGAFSVPDPAPAKELPATYEEFEEGGAAKTGLAGWWERFKGWVHSAVKFGRWIASEIITSGESTKSIAERIESELAETFRDAGEASFANAEFARRFEETLGTRFLGGNKVEPLVDGPASFAKRFELIDAARRTIHIMSWAIYDDETGWLTAQKLIAKHREGVRVRVVVDGQTAEEPGHGGRILPCLEAAGIPVVRWRGPGLARFDGQHRKVMIVDSRAAIAGGMNFGNDYSHIGSPSQRWRDTDMLIEGPAALESERLFARVWNGQAGSLHLELLPEPEAPAADGGARVALIDHQPGTERGIKAILLAVETARRSIDIENAYFIADPALARALRRARDRGVRVRILTNSSESVDEPVVTYPILKSAEDARAGGLEVYLKKGSTLHSKFMVVDDEFAWLGSYNIQPRSHHIEAEVLYAVLDACFAGSLRAAFEADIAAAERVEGPISLPKSLFSRLAYFLFYNQL